MKIIIIGGGPAGLSSADHLARGGHEVVVFEKGPVGGNISRYPTYMTWFSTRELLELGGLPLTIPQDKPTRRDYMIYLLRFVEHARLDVRTYHEVLSVTGGRGGFRVQGRALNGREFEEQGEIVVLATGAYDHPQRLGVPGEDLPKVSHYYTEPLPYHGRKVLVVGGRGSAVEAALELWRNGARVSLSYRREIFPDSLKYWLRPDIENRIRAGEIQAYMPSHVVSIEPETVTLEHRGKEVSLSNDFVLALTGYEPDTSFLEKLGVRFDPESKKPEIDPETYESNVPGIYIVGVMQAGNISSEIFIENSRRHGEVLARALAKPNGTSGETG
ncbi:MAG: Ferredoxin--NADP reductase [bacterium]|nr:Ferredoxin--NADP reductase [bacterium]